MFRWYSGHLCCAAIYLFVTCWLLETNLAEAVLCLDCVDENCNKESSYCYGKFCASTRYTLMSTTMSKANKSVIVRGCLSGSMITDDLIDHCEAPSGDLNAPLDCFCSANDRCNSPAYLASLPVEPIQLLTCYCKGSKDCAGKSTCQGLLCYYMIDQETKAVEQGCTGRTLPIVERRLIGACTMPPFDASLLLLNKKKDLNKLLNTEACLCDKNLCNDEKPAFATAVESMRCETFIRGTIMNNVMSTTLNPTCYGEYCLRVNVTSSRGPSLSYESIGCVSFSDGAQLMEEMKASGCAVFTSQALTVEACLLTDDYGAVLRSESKMQPSHPLLSTPDGSKKPLVLKIPAAIAPPSPQEQDEIAEAWSNDEESAEDSSVTLVAAFIIIIIAIVIIGLCWKYDCHRLFVNIRASRYATVAGG